MSNRSFEYHVKQEDELVHQIHTVELVMWAVQNTVQAHEKSLHIGTLLTIVDSILDIDLELQQDLYSIRLLKQDTARLMNMKEV